MGWTGQNDYQSIHHWPHVFSPCKIVNGISILFLKNQDQAGSDKKWGVFICVCVFICFACRVCIFLIVPVFASATYLYFHRPRIYIFLGHVFVFSSSACTWPSLTSAQSGPSSVPTSGVAQIGRSKILKPTFWIRPCTMPLSVNNEHPQRRKSKQMQPVLNIIR